MSSVDDLRARLVPAVCTQCGAALEVDPTQEAAVCKYCNTPFIVDKAIQNYNINGNINFSKFKCNLYDLETNLQEVTNNIEKESNFNINDLLNYAINNTKKKMVIMIISDIEPFGICSKRILFAIIHPS